MIQAPPTDRVRIAVSQRVDVIPARDEQRDALDGRLVRWLGLVGALAFPVPNGLIAGGALLEWLDVISPEGVLLSGGNDIGESPERDSTEVALLRYANDLDLPLLGICRGMEMMAHQAGVMLVPSSGHSSTLHDLYSIEGEHLPTTVNSYHDWCLTTCPDDYRVLARAPDGSIEAIRHLNRNWEGWMWHPEREKVLQETSILRARSLFRVSGRR